jgi:hypothetical protein
MSNALTRHVGLNAGNWVLETLLKHYFEHLFKNRENDSNGATSSGSPGTSGDLRRDELLYDEVFYIVKVRFKIVSRVDGILEAFSHF